MFYLVKKINKTVCAAWKQWAKKHGSNPLLATLTSVPPWPQPLFLINLAKVSTDRATRCLKIAENMKRATMSTCDFLPPLTPIGCHICHHMTRCECERMDYSVSSPQAWVLVRIQEKKGVILSGGLKNPDDVEQNSVWDCPESSYDWSGKLLTIIKKKTPPTVRHSYWPQLTLNTASGLCTNYFNDPDTGGSIFQSAL